MIVSEHMAFQFEIEATLVEVAIIGFGTTFYILKNKLKRIESTEFEKDIHLNY